MAWPCSPFWWDSDFEGFSMVVYDVDFFLITIYGPQSCHWIFVGLWLFWTSKAKSIWSVSSDMIRGSNCFSNSAVAVLHPAEGAKWSSILISAKQSVYILNHKTNIFLLHQIFCIGFWQIDCMQVKVVNAVWLVTYELFECLVGILWILVWILYNPL